MALKINALIERLDLNQDTQVEQIKFVGKDEDRFRGYIEIPRSIRSYEEKSEIFLLIKEQKKENIEENIDLRFNSILFKEEILQDVEYPYVYIFSAGGFVSRIEFANFVWVPCVKR